MAADEATCRLFSYGTLRYPAVQRATFGREIKGQPDVLPGYHKFTVAITDGDVIATSGEASHPIVRYTGDPAHGVEGMVFEITKDELASADKYEVSDYKRIAVRLRSGMEAFVYVEAASTG